MSEETKKYYCHYKRIYYKVIRKARKLTNTMRIRAHENKAKAMWDLIKEELGTQAKTLKNIEINMNGSNIRDPETIANVFNVYYESIAQKILEDKPLAKTNGINLYRVKYNSNSMFLTPATEEEVVELIKGLDNKKSMGLDDIPDYIIKKCHTNITTALTYIINLSLSTGKFPDQLKIVKVKPLYKKGSDTEVGNYRPVSLISGFSKIIEKVIKKRLV
jgi:hypothetical protein